VSAHAPRQNRPQRLGGSGTRHRNLFVLCFVNSAEECLPV